MSNNISMTMSIVDMAFHPLTLRVVWERTTRPFCFKQAIIYRFRRLTSDVETGR